MATPAYHLRPNKAVDRQLFIEIIRVLLDLNSEPKYKYYGFGGPYLDDFRIIHEIFPNLKMLSIEKESEVFKRQEFHKPTRKIKLLHDELHSFIATYSETENENSIFWLDYTDLRYSMFEEFMSLLTRVNPGSIIKISLAASPKKFENKVERFQNEFVEILPDQNSEPPEQVQEFGMLIKEMLEIASEKALHESPTLNFLPLSSFYYKDGAGMFTLTGIVCEDSEILKMKNIFKNWDHNNFDWDKEPEEINVPILSSKERLHLQKYLPKKSRDMVKALGYKIEGNQSIGQMEQYSKYYRFYPYYIRGVL